MNKDTALLIIDAQVNMFEPTPIYNSAAVLQNLRQLIARARAAGAPVIHVQNCGGPGDPDEPGTPGWAIHPALAPVEGELVIQKHRSDSFHETPLRAELDSRGVKRLVIAGMQSEYCVTATTRRAVKLGYDVTLVSDAHSTYNGSSLTAPEIIVWQNETLGMMAVLKSTNEIAF